MFKKISFTTLFVILTMSATACAPQGFQLPTSLPQLPDLTQPSVSAAPATSNLPEQSAQGAPNPPVNQPQAGLNGNGGKRGNREAILLQMLNRLGWESGVVTKLSSDQITLRAIERPGFQNNQGQNQPGTNQPNPNQPGQNRKDFQRVETINVDSSTIVIVPGNPNATLSDLRVGDRILTDMPQAKTVAALVLSMPKNFDKNDVVAGLVTSNSNGAITVRAPGGGDTVTTSATTQVFKLTRDGVTPGLVRDLTNGSIVIALGAGTDDTFTAQAILALPKGALDLGKGLGNGKKNNQPQQPTAPNSGG